MTNGCASEVDGLVGFNIMIGSSRVMQPVFAAMAQAGVTTAPVLVTGEQSTGKTLCARLICASSVNKGGSLQTVDCRNVDETAFLEQFTSEYVRTLMGDNHRSDLLLKDVDALPALAQQRVLDVFADPEVGGAARVIATSSKRLGQEVDEGRFSRELFLLLNKIRIDMPPLRHRKADNMSLATYYLGRISSDVRLSDEAVKELMHYSWPGNIGELIQVLSYAVQQCAGTEIQKYHLPKELVKQGDDDMGIDMDYILSSMIDQAERAGMNYDELHGLVECRLLNVLLERYDFRSSCMAEAWHINRVTLLNKRKKYGLP